MNQKRWRDLAKSLIDSLDRLDQEFAVHLKNAVAAGFDPYQPIKDNLICIKPPLVFGDFVLRIHDAPLITNILHAPTDVDAFGTPLQSFRDICQALPPNQASIPTAGTLVGDEASGDVAEHLRAPRQLNLLEALPYMDTGTLHRDAKFDCVLGIVDATVPAVRAEMAAAIPAYFRLMDSNSWTQASGELCMAKLINAGADLSLLARQGQRLDFAGSNLLTWMAATPDSQVKHAGAHCNLEIMEQAVGRLLALEHDVRDKLFDIELASKGTGNTALMLAIELSSTKMVGLLLDAGADMLKPQKTKRKDKVRVSPYTLAQVRGRHDVVQMMEALRAQRMINTVLGASCGASVLRT